jgi:hypothetical protein
LAPVAKKAKLMIMPNLNYNHHHHHHLHKKYAWPENSCSEKALTEEKSQNNKTGVVAVVEVGIFEQGGLREGGHSSHNGMNRCALAKVLSETLLRQYHLDQDVDPKMQGPHKILMFQARSKPNIPFEVYLEQLVLGTGMSGESLMLAMVHLARFAKRNPEFPINILTIYRLFLTVCLCACKFYDDQFSNNKKFAKTGGVTLQEMNILEIEYLFMSGFNMYVSDEQYQEIYKELLITNPNSPKYKPQPPPPNSTKL